MDNWSNLFNKEPHVSCERCGKKDVSAEWVDNGFGPYAVQVSPYHCDLCGWVETGCPAEECIKEKCFSWNTCQGKSISEER